MKNKYIIIEGKLELLMDIEKLWEKLNQHHLNNTEYFKAKYRENTFERRAKSILDKASSGDIQVLLAKDSNSEVNIGYCVSTVTQDGVGEIDSLFIESTYRKLGIGDELIRNALKWLESKQPKEIVLTVAGGNERVLDFYKRYGFHTTAVKLAKVDCGTGEFVPNYKEYMISADKSKLVIDDIVEMLGKSYWANQRSRERILKSIEHSLCFGVYDKGKQIGFARMITDYVTQAYLCDVIINDEYRGQGIGKALMTFITTFPDLQEVKSWLLATQDAHKLYEKYGYGSLLKPENFMVKRIEGKY